MQLLIARRDLGYLGVSRSKLERRLASGQWARVLPGVFVTDPEALCFDLLIKAAALWAPDGVVSFTSAARLLRLPSPSVDKVEITLPRRTNSPAPWLVTHSHAMETCDILRIDGTRVTGACRTTIDLASKLSEAEISALLGEALRRNLATLPQFIWRLERLPERTKGIRLIKQLVDELANGVPASELERALRRALKGSAVPIGIFGFRVDDPHGRMFIDMAYPDRMVAVECDSFAHHATKEELQNDGHRRNRLTLLGWNVLHFTWHDIVHNPMYVRGVILAALDAERRRH